MLAGVSAIWVAHPRSTRRLISSVLKPTFASLSTRSLVIVLAILVVALAACDSNDRTDDLVVRR